MLFKIALRNTFRNRRRSLLAMAMIAGGVTAIVLFEGFAHNMVEGLRETTIKTQTGHLQIASKHYWNKTGTSPKDNLISHYAPLMASIQKDPRVDYVAGRLSFFALMSKEDNSLSARGVSFEPGRESGRSKAFNFTKGKPLSGKNVFEIGVGAGLAQKLSAKVGDRITLLGHTFDGTVNAIDVEVSGIFQTAISEFDDNTFIIPLKAAQTLLDTTAVELVVVGLKQTDTTDSVAAVVTSRLPPTLQAKKWEAVAQLYTQVSTFNKVQNRVVEVIILSLILLGIMNTVAMSIFERTGEIGTVRAMGETRKRLVKQFVLEGTLLGLFGALLGVGMGFGIASLVNAMKIPLVIPGASTFLQIKIDLFFESFRDAFIVCVFASTVAAILPAIRASKLNIAEALRHNI